MQHTAWVPLLDVNAYKKNANDIHWPIGLVQDQLMCAILKVRVASPLSTLSIIPWLVCFVCVCLCVIFLAEWPRVPHDEPSARAVGCAPADPASRRQGQGGRARGAVPESFAHEQGGLLSVYLRLIARVGLDCCYSRACV